MKRLVCGVAIAGIFVWADLTRTFAQQPADRSVTQNLIEHAVSSCDGSAAWTFDRRLYDEELRDLPIGVFDSGIGGLTVLEAILSLDAHHNETLKPGADGRPDFENETFIYFGDQANMPYGNYPAVDQQDYLQELILKDVVFLLGKRYWKSGEEIQPALDKPPVKAIAIGCNTATAYGLKAIEEVLAAWNIPVFVVGVVSAGADGVLDAHRQRADQSVAVLATVATCNSQAYPKAIAAAMGQAGRRVPPILQQGFVELAAAIEGDPSVTRQMTAGDYIHRDLLQLLEHHRQAAIADPIGTIVLGCTHFPLVKEEFLSALQRIRGLEQGGLYPYANLVSQQITIVDPAELTAKQLFRSLALARLRATRSTNEASTNPQKVTGNRYFISIPNRQLSDIELSDDGGFTHQYKYGRRPNELQREDTRIIPMSLDAIPESSRVLIQTRLPNVWNDLKDS